MIPVFPLLADGFSISLLRTYRLGLPNSEHPMPGSPLVVPPLRKMENMLEAIFCITHRSLSGAVGQLALKNREKGHISSPLVPRHSAQA